MSKRGTFIVIEGINGAGKSTLANGLANSLPGSTEILKFPSNRTPAGRAASRMLHREVHKTELDLFQHLMVQDRIAVGAEIEQLLRKGFNVIADRYTMSGVAYGTADGLNYAELLNLNSYCLKPDFCILIDVPADAALIRQLGGGRAYVRSGPRQRQAASLFRDLWLAPLSRQHLCHERTGWVIVYGHVTEVREQAMSALEAWGLFKQQKEETLHQETKQPSPHASVWQSVATELSRELTQTRTLLSKLTYALVDQKRGIDVGTRLRDAREAAELYLESKQHDAEGQKDELIGILAQQNEKLITELRALGVERD